MGWTIRTAGLADADELPAVEFSAGRRFLTIPDLASLPDDADMSVDTHRKLIAQGTEWVALDQNFDFLGFLATEIIESELHLWELAVRLDAQNQGIGGRLIEVATAFALERQLKSLTLTTFAHVPWNAAWYARLGFELVTDDKRLAALTREEAERGWPHRCAMRKRLEALAWRHPAVIPARAAPVAAGNFGEP